MGSTPLFSVLIANYNNGCYLQDAIDSVLSQDYDNWEIVIVDDKSTDNSFEVYEKYKNDERFRLFYNEENLGCGYTKRRCAELANGEICGFLDPDDVLEKDAIEVMVREHENYDDVSLVYSRFYLSDLHLNVVGVSEQQCELPQGVSFLEYGRGAISHFATYKKAYYDQTIGINPCYKRAVDHALYYLLEEVGQVRFIDKPLYYYRFNTGKNISTYNNKDKAFFWDMVVMEDACKRRGLDVEEVVYKHYEKYLENEKSLSFKQGEARVRGTKAYRVGKKVLWPFKLLK